MKPRAQKSASQALALEDLAKKIQAELRTATAKTKVAERLVEEVKGHHFNVMALQQKRNRLITAPNADAMPRRIGERANG